MSISQKDLMLKLAGRVSAPLTVSDHLRAAKAAYSLALDSLLAAASLLGREGRVVDFSHELLMLDTDDAIQTTGGLLKQEREG